MKIVSSFVIAATLGLAACGGAYSLSTAEQSTAELGARSMAEASGGKFISCSGQDSDKDGYVTCSAVLVKDAAPEELSCSYKENARGCKRKGR